MGEKIRTAVVGVGYLGRFHARKYAALAKEKENIECVAVADSNFTRAKEVAEECGCQAVERYSELAGLVDAVSIAATTSRHYEIAKFFLQNGVDVLLEKPMTVTLAEADELISLAEKKSTLLQIGHIERFNPTVKMACSLINKPLFIKTTRIAPFKPRGTDVSVVLDLMIHDIDLLLSITDSDITEIEAVGVSPVSGKTDFAHANITFSGGLRANITVSRIAPKTVRRMHILQQNDTIDIDFDKRKIATFPFEREKTEQEFSAADALLEEIAAFLDHVQNRSRPQVSGEEGRKALAVALDVMRIIEEQEEKK